VIADMWVTIDGGERELMEVETASAHAFTVAATRLEDREEWCVPTGLTTFVLHANKASGVFRNHHLTRRTDGIHELALWNRVV